MNQRPVLRDPETRCTFRGIEGNLLVADGFGDGPRTALLLHGGGQTRHSWRRTAEALAAQGWTAYALDQRGHGDSDWPASGDYTFPRFAADAGCVADAIAAETGARPVAIGASLGGIASLLCGGDPHREEPAFAALVLVDITPRVSAEGVARIHGFMRAHSETGFATIQEAADEIAAYLPHRPRPASLDGLKKNLRRREDGRWRWHWDPRFMQGPRAVGTRTDEMERQMAAAARNIRVPTLLVRGASSELVDAEHVRDFLDLVPHAEYVDIAGARHMVAGDSNDQFSSAVLDFLARA